MAHGTDRIVQQHTGPRIGHGCFDALTHNRFVAGGLARAAERLLFHAGAPVDALVGIVDKRAAFRTRHLISVMVALAVEADHSFNRRFLLHALALENHLIASDGSATGLPLLLHRYLLSVKTEKHRRLRYNINDSAYGYTWERLLPEWRSPLRRYRRWRARAHRVFPPLRRS